MPVLDDPVNFFGVEALQDPYRLYARMRAEALVHRIGDSEFYAVCGWDAVVDAVTRAEDFSSNLTATMVYRDDGTITSFPMMEAGAPATPSTLPRSTRQPGLPGADAMPARSVS